MRERLLWVETYDMEIIVATLAPSFFDWIILAGNEDTYKISNKFEIQSDLTRDYGVCCP